MSTDTRSRRTASHVEWAVYELDENGDPTGDFWPATSRAVARTLRDEVNAKAGAVKYGVFRRLVTVTRD